MDCGEKYGNNSKTAEAYMQVCVSVVTAACAQTTVSFPALTLPLGPALTLLLFKTDTSSRYESLTILVLPGLLRADESF